MSLPICHSIFGSFKRGWQLGATRKAPFHKWKVCDGMVDGKLSTWFNVTIWHIVIFIHISSCTTHHLVFTNSSASLIIQINSIFWNGTVPWGQSFWGSTLFQHKIKGHSLYIPVPVACLNSSTHSISKIEFITLSNSQLRIKKVLRYHSQRGEFLFIL